AIRDAYGLERLIAEERMAHPVVRGLDQPTAVEARIRLSSFPWVRILDSTQRHYVPERSLAHLLGRLEDAGPDDVFAQELSGEFRGMAGAEQLGEDRLRGVPGSIEEDIEGRPVSPPVPPQNGEDLRLTIDLWLQQQIHERLRGAVEAYPVCTGGSAVVIDVASREVLALVSYPDFDPNPGFEKRRALEMLRKTVPFRFRAVDMSYPPGSIIKPLVLAGALSDGVVTAGGHTTCTGALFPETPDRFRCIVPHGPVDATAAIAKSCNVYFYRTGEAVGIPRLCFWFEAAGLGRVSGTGLREEFRGRLPRTQSRGQARFAAVGQGELELTPIQAANMMACVASGVHQDVTLVCDDPRERPATSLGVAAEHWAVVREAMWRVVNAPGGTAYGSDKTVPPPEPWALLGKTGSAEAWARTLDTRYVCEWPDGRREEFIATDRADLRRRLAGQEPYEVVGWQSHRRWPPPEQMATHAWFAGYLVHRSALSRLGQRPDRAVALAVVLEYAGHGGSEAGPVAGDLARMILEVWPTDR
ncbi:MAG: hypothetical protein JXA69_05155, partial [Phycisphaerae bacterium]|nr:hypothetical protein [Phycisphaerae bacterium]